MNYESPVVAAIEAIRRGVNVYAPSYYMEPPFGLHMYTPLYHYVVSLFVSPAGNPFLAGRIVSLACMVMAGALLLAVAPSGSRRASVVAIGLFFLFWPVSRNAAIVRPDAMALLFSAAAVVLVARRPDDRRAIIAAASLCVLAFATKQSFLAAPVACALFLMQRDKRGALLFAASYVTLAVLFIAVAEIASGGGFLFSIASGGRQPIALHEVWVRFTNLSGQPLSVIWAAAALVATAVLVSKSRYRRSSPYALYAAMTWIVFLATAGKMGAAPNYYLAPMLSSLMLGVWYARYEDSDKPSATSRIPSPVAATLLLALVGFDMWRSNLGDYAFVLDPPAAKARREEIADGRRLLSGTDHRKGVLNLAHAVHTWWLPAPVSMPDVFLYAMMWREGTLDEEPVVRSIERGDYAAIVSTDKLLEGDREPFTGASWKRVTEAALRTYPCRISGGGLLVLLPRNHCANRVR